MEVDVKLTDGVMGRAAVPSGASTGSHEAVELRDGGGRFGGKGVLTAVKNINTELADYLVDKEWDQVSLDEAMVKLDGTENKGRLGANSIFGISMAFAHASSLSPKNPLYQYQRG